MCSTDTLQRGVLFSCTGQMQTFDSQNFINRQAKVVCASGTTTPVRPLQVNHPILGLAGMSQYTPSYVSLLTPHITPQILQRHVAPPLPCRLINATVHHTIMHVSYRMWSVTGNLLTGYQTARPKQLSVISRYTALSAIRIILLHSPGSKFSAIIQSFAD